MVYGVIVLILTVLAVGSQLLLDTVEVALPTETFWPVLPEGVEMFPGGDARFVGGGFTEALASVTGLGLATRALLAAGTLVQGLTQLAVTWAVFLIAHRLLARRAVPPRRAQGGPGGRGCAHRRRHPVAGALRNR